MDIKTCSQKSGISKNTLRFYEKIRLIVPARSENNYRDYSARDVAKLKIACCLKKGGLQLNEIIRILKLYDAPVTEICHEDTLMVLEHYHKSFERRAKLDLILSDIAFRMGEAVKKQMGQDVMMKLFAEMEILDD